MRVAVAMSGGVDSSVAAALLHRAGHEVAGFTLQLWQRDNAKGRHGGCCSLDAVEDARRVATHLGIAYYVLNLERDFRETVISDFTNEYAAGRTPNPCIRCNQWIKFGLLLDRALSLGFDCVATGHYARVLHDGGRWSLLRAEDRHKDQSYVLWMLGQRELARTLFPLGGLTKEEVRRLAAAMGLLVAAKPESQDLCFVADGDYRQELRRRIPAALEPGPVVDETGRRLGTHAGIGSVTVGQRTGLGIRPTGPDSRPLYVRSIDPATRAVVVGRREDLLVSRLELTEPSFVAGDAPLPMEHLEVRIRHGGELAGCRLEGGSVAVLDRPLAGVAPGQSAVLYRGPEVIGGGLIRRAA